MLVAKLWRVLQSSRLWLNTFLLVCLFILAVFMALLSRPQDDWVSATAQNLSSELIGAILTYIVIEMVGHYYTVKLEEKLALIQQLGDPDNAISIKAVSDMWYLGWLQDGSMVSKSLRFANLEEADLGLCDLRKVEFYRANLQNARLWADLRGANLLQANLAGAQLVYSGDPNEFLPEGEGVRVPRAYKDGTPHRALLDGKTILPDGKPWREERDGFDLARFTDATHPDFWRSGERNSPAFRNGDNATHRRHATKADVEAVVVKVQALADKLDGK